MDGCLNNAQAGQRLNYMSRLAIGTAQFGLPYGIANTVGQLTDLAGKKILQLAKDNSINMLDTAIAYGGSESSLGGMGVDAFNLVTKLPAIPNDCDDIDLWAREQLELSLGRLNVDSVYGLLLHCPEQLLMAGGDVLFNTLCDFKKKSLVQKIGVSIYSPEELDLLTRHYKFDLVQAPLNLVDRRLVVSGWLQRLKRDGVEIHVRSAFLQGLLLMSRRMIPLKFELWAEQWDNWHSWLLHNPATAVQACLNYPLSFPEVDRVILGADSSTQLLEIIEASKIDPIIDFPDLYCADEKLINPSNWTKL